jgi:hypothetical protein
MAQNTHSSHKPTSEAKALSLFLMAYKSKKPIYKEQSKRINRQWDLFRVGDLSKKKYLEEVGSLLKSYGGYSEVVEKTVKHYIDKTGEWTLKGDDQYCIDAQKVADKLLKK